MAALQRSEAGLAHQAQGLVAVPGPRASAALRRAVLGTGDPGPIVVGSSPRRAYWAALAPHRPGVASAQGSVLTHPQVVGGLRTGPAGPGLTGSPPPRSSAEAGAGVSCGNPADGKSPAQQQPGPRCHTHSSRRGGSAGPTVSCFPLMSPMGGQHPRAARAHARWAAAGCAPGAWVCWGQAGGPRQAGWGRRPGGKTPALSAEGREGLQRPRGEGRVLHTAV